jgi:hypothetical protein
MSNIYIPKGPLRTSSRNGIQRCECLVLFQGIFMISLTTNQWCGSNVCELGCQPKLVPNPGLFVTVDILLLIPGSQVFPSVKEIQQAQSWED